MSFPWLDSIEQKFFWETTDIISSKLAENTDHLSLDSVKITPKSRREHCSNTPSHDWTKQIKRTFVFILRCIAADAPEKRWEFTIDRDFYDCPWVLKHYYRLYSELPLREKLAREIAPSFYRSNYPNDSKRKAWLWDMIRHNLCPGSSCY
jgi:hypothetical protein